MVINVFDCNVRCVSLGSRASPAAWWKEPCQWLLLPTKPCSLDKAPHRWASSSFPQYMSYICTVYWNVYGPLRVVLLLRIICIIDSSVPFRGLTRVPLQPPADASTQDTMMAVLVEMGFGDRPLNQRLLNKYNYNLLDVVNELVQMTDNDWYSTRYWRGRMWEEDTRKGTKHERERCEKWRGRQTGGEKIHFCPFTFSSDWSS